MFLSLFIITYLPGFKKIFFRRIEKNRQISVVILLIPFLEKTYFQVYEHKYICQITLGLFYYELTTKLELKSVSPRGVIRYSLCMTNIEY